MKSGLARGLTLTSLLLLASSVTAATLMERYHIQMDQTFGTVSEKTVYEKTDDKDASDPWNFKNEFNSVADAVKGYKDFALQEADETMALLKNDGALPLAKGTTSSKKLNVTMMGLRSYAPVYGNNGGSIPDKATIDDGNHIWESFEKQGFVLNPKFKNAYKAYTDSLTWGGKGFGATPPEYVELKTTTGVPELSPSELAEIDSDIHSDDSQYSDAAIVVFGREGGEANEYTVGPSGVNSDTKTSNGNILSLSEEEKAVLKDAEDHFKKVIVLINSTQAMEIKDLKDDKKVNAILWVGYPGSYGFESVAKILRGEVNPSAYLGDTYITNGMASPALQAQGKIPWTNPASDFTEGANVNSYLVEAEGIYSGYRYYETRYEDIVKGVSGASNAKAGTYSNADTTIATTDGTWNYDNEVVYPFGYGLSYTNFSEKLDNVEIASDKKTGKVTVTVTNTGDVAGKKAIQLYAKAPYTDYDKENRVEKSAVQLINYEKTKLLKPGEKQTITLDVDFSNLASYDYTKAKTYILDPGDYYLSIGDDAHSALNNILAKQGLTPASTDHRMDAEGNSDLVYRWKWDDFDDSTFRYEENGTEITNQLSSGDSSMDLNSFDDYKNTVTYLTRADWNGTFPKSYSGLEAKGRVKELLNDDFYTLKTGEDTSSIKFGQAGTLKLSDLKGAAWSDERYDQLANQVSIEEFLDFASHAFHNIQGIPSVGFEKRNADDGPGGSDTHTFKEGSTKGVAWSDAKTSADGDKGTRIAPSPENLAYSFNKELSYRNGEIILGETSLDLNLPIMIGPGGNLHRHGYNGRGSEYYSEDPILSGFTGSAVVQGAQSKGCLVNIKHAAFNDQENNRSGIAVFMNEQKAREMELRNLRQMFLAKGKPASFVKDSSKADTYKLGALGVMTSYNRIGAVPSSGNYGMMQKILREEWGFTGYNVTDFTGVSLKASPKESILAGTVAFCGFGKPSLSYWNAQSLTGDKAMAEAIHKDIKYILYSLAQSNALNGINSSTVAKTVKLNTWWRTTYITLISVFSVTTAALLVLTGLSIRKEN